PVTGFTFGFRFFSTYVVGGPPKIYDALVRGDFNGDGRDDLVAMLQTNELQIILQRPDGTFDEPIVYQQESTYLWRKILRVADFNNDGADDVVFDYIKDAFGSSGMAIMLSQVGRQPALAWQPLDSVVVGSQGGTLPNGVLTFDYDGDGNMDLVEVHGWDGAHDPAGCIPNDSCPHMVVYAGDGQGSVGAPQYVPWAGSPDPDGRDFFMHDVDMDGRSDIVFTARFGNPEQDKLYYLKRALDGTFADPQLLVDMHVDGPPFFGDLNSDGRTDLVNGSLIWLRRADGTFDPAGTVTYDMLDVYWSILGDFDGNGQTDLITREFYEFFEGTYFSIYLQKNATIQNPFYLDDPFTPHFVSPDKWGRQAFTTGDFNADGCLDVAIAIGYDGILLMDGQKCLPHVP
ncbi:MAG TPA: VCBS repeat-containing protein, partial [Thermomonas sp.]